MRAFNDGNDKIFNKANVRVTSMSKDRNKAIIPVLKMTDLHRGIGYLIEKIIDW